MFEFKIKYIRRGCFRCRFGSAAGPAVWVLLLFFLPGIRRSESAEIDRLLAAVNGVVITSGDIEVARRVSVLLASGKSVKPASKREEIERLIDLELMRQELMNFGAAQENEARVEARMNELRDSFADIGDLPALLYALGLQEFELISYLKLESAILGFVDFRFRPFVKVSEEEIKEYYEKSLLPQLLRQKVGVPPLAQVSAGIADVLREEKINADLDRWIREIRRNSRIEYFDDR